MVGHNMISSTRQQIHHMLNRMPWLLPALLIAWLAVPLFCAGHGAATLDYTNAQLISIDGHRDHAMHAATSCEDSGNRISSASLSLLTTLPALLFVFSLPELLRFFRSLKRHTHTTINQRWRHEPPIHLAKCTFLN